MFVTDYTLKKIMSANDQGIVAVTGRAHCELQVTFLHNKPAFHNWHTIYRWCWWDSIYYWWIMEGRFIIEKPPKISCSVKTNPPPPPPPWNVWLNYFDSHKVYTFLCTAFIRHFYTPCLWRNTCNRFDFVSVCVSVRPSVSLSQLNRRTYMAWWSSS